MFPNANVLVCQTVIRNMKLKCMCRLEKLYKDAKYTSKMMIHWYKQYLNE